MTDIDHALSDLAFIRGRLAASTRFRGLAPHAVAATGVLALVLAGAQAACLTGSARRDCHSSWPG